MKCTNFNEEYAYFILLYLILYFVCKKKQTILTCDIDNAETDTIKATEYDLDHNLWIKDINNIMLK